jgi:hypothetical protein
MLVKIVILTLAVQGMKGLSEGERDALYSISPERIDH